MKKVSQTRIGFDFDKIFVNYPQFIPDALVNRLYKKKTQKLTYRFPGTIEQKIRIFSHHHLFRTPIMYNINVLKAISRNGIETYLISSRFGFLKNKTEYWVRKYSMQRLFKEIHFNYDNNQPHKFKEGVLRQLRLTHYIDDDLDLLLYLSKKLPSTHFYWLTSNSKYNKKLPGNISVIKTLKDIPKKLYS